MRLSHAIRQPGADKKSGLRPCRDQAADFQRGIGMQRRGYADTLLPAEGAYGRHAVTGPQRIAADGAFQQTGQPLVGGLFDRMGGR